MSVSGDYPHPVTVNGFSCKNCTDVDYAKKHIDPSHPKSGPYDVDAQSDPSRKQAVTFGGSLSGLAGSQSIASATSVQATSPGQKFNILV
jgi:hypothetical protein